MNNDVQGSLFLWGGDQPKSEVGPLVRRGNSWWLQLRESANWLDAQLEELEQSATALVGLLPDPQGWPNSHPIHRGLVVGAVQSGKTTHMMATSAIAIDQGFKIVIVLAGLADDLRRQTALRFNTGLMRQSDVINDLTGATTLGLPESPGPLGGFALPFFYDANQYSHLALHMRRALASSEPCVVVVKKNPASLRELRLVLHHLFERFGPETLPTLVIDDECDEASVPGYGQGVVIPDAISEIWTASHLQPYIAYVGYTATAAASLLQDPRNPLFPSDFVFLLRHPGSDTTSLAYSEPLSDNWYTGAHCFYEEFGEEADAQSNFLVSTSVSDSDPNPDDRPNPRLNEALIAFFVSGAFRLALSPEKEFDDLDNIPLPHSMLVQTSTERADHLDLAREIIEICGGHEEGDGIFSLDPQKLVSWSCSDEKYWEGWYKQFNDSRERIHSERPHNLPFINVTWDQVRGRLNEVFTNTNLKLVNSDELYGSSLNYRQSYSASGKPTAPEDIFVIVIGGQKLSRGLTIEGLCTTYFARWSRRPHDDTVQQLSRWFGYRSKYLEFCRLFTSEESFSRLREINNNDSEHRELLGDLMAEGRPLSEARLVLRSSPTSILTGKIGVGTQVSIRFSPRKHVFTNLESGVAAGPNEEAAWFVVEEIRQRGGADVWTVGGTKRGELSRGWNADEVANLLEGFQYQRHNPDHLEAPLKEYYRLPEQDRTTNRGFNPLDDPYLMAAYLKFWAQHPSEWGQVPTFNVGFAFGNKGNEITPFDFPLLDKKITSSDKLEGGWTGRSSGWLGDTLFDSPPVSQLLGDDRRAEGCPGLLLLYIVHKSATGRSGEGKVRDFHTPTFCISVPGGGPEFDLVLMGGHYPVP